MRAASGRDRRCSLTELVAGLVRCEVDWVVWLGLGGLVVQGLQEVVIGVSYIMSNRSWFSAKPRAHQRNDFRGVEERTAG